MLHLLAMGLGGGRVRDTKIEERLDELGALLFDALDPVKTEVPARFQAY